MFRIMMLMLLARLVAGPCRAEFRDPTQPAYPQQSAAAGSDTAIGNELVLSAIWISAQSRRATINGVSAKQGQTIVIGPVLPLKSKPEIPVNSTAASNKDGLLNKVMKSVLGQPSEYANAESNRSSQENIENMIAPLLSATIEHNKLPQLQEQRSMNMAPGNKQQASSAQHSANAHGMALPPLSKTGYIPAPSSVIKIISIRENSVTIDQNGELKTLQLVQRSYKTQ